MCMENGKIKASSLWESNTKISDYDQNHADCPVNLGEVKNNQI